MEKNLIFFFSATGNSLKVAKDIADVLENCEVVTMGVHNRHILIEPGYSRIGFIYPVYGAGLPKQVIRFIGSLNLSGNKEAYYFSVPTYGTVSGNALAQTDKLLQAKGAHLNYGIALKMVHNNCANFNMNSKNVPKRNAEANSKIPDIVSAIKSKAQTPAPKEKFPFTHIHPQVMKLVSNGDRNFNVSAVCTGCGTCSIVCPVNNIEIVDKRPSFQHRCEQCFACIQWCPTKAINYKNASQRRGRFHNPHITLHELIEKNRGSI
jgi:ferredoxin/flavodoxin